MKMTTMMAAAALALGASAATVEELNKIPVKDVTPANAIEVFDAAVAVTNLWKIHCMVSQGKVSLEDAVHRTMNKRPLAMCNYAFAGAPTVTNHTLVAEVLSSLDYAALADKDTLAAREIIFRHRFPGTEAGKAEVARAYAENKLFGAEIYCSVWSTVMKEIMTPHDVEAYEEVKSIVKTQANKHQAAILWWFGASIKDFDSFQMMYDKSLLDLSFWWLYPNTTRPQYAQLQLDLIEAYKASPSKANDSKLLSRCKTVDKACGNKSTTLGAIDFLSNSKAKLDAALYCNNADKLIEVLATCDTSLGAKDIEAALPAVNALDPDYKPAEVLRALKAVNQRYTLKLYDDRDAWEPVLSKIRAMIDCR